VKSTAMSRCVEALSYEVCFRERVHINSDDDDWHSFEDDWKIAFNECGVVYIDTGYIIYIDILGVLITRKN
jgi:hypothetical protein